MTPPEGTTENTDNPGSTSSSLLERVKSADDDSWQRLTEVYGPLVYRWARSFGIPASESADLMQEVFQGVSTGISKFRGKPEGHSFRGWLRAITRNKASDYFRRCGNQPEVVGGTDFQVMLAQFAEAGDASSISGLDQSDRCFVLRQILDEVACEFQHNTWKAFWRVTIEGHSAVDVAQDLGMTPNAVRQAKFRVLRRIRQDVDGIDLM